MKDNAKLKVLSNLKSKITIKRKTMVADGYGGYEDGSELVRSCRASIRPLRATEIFQGNQVQQETTHNIFIRYFNGLENSDVIVYKNKIFEITSIINVDNNNEFYELICKEKGN